MRVRGFLTGGNGGRRGGREGGGGDVGKGGEGGGDVGKGGLLKVICVQCSSNINIEIIITCLYHILQ